MTIPLRTDDAAPSAAPARATTAARLAPDVWLVIAITAIAALLRFSAITSQSFWVDEAVTVHEVGLSFGAMLHAIHLNESTPPLYYALAWLWTRVFGSGALGIRSLSALAGTALVPVVYLCARELVGRAAGVVAAALIAVSPFMIWYSQEARSYMPFAFLGGLSFLYCARASRTHARVDLGAWAACSALMILTHFFACFQVVPEALWLLWCVRGRVCVIACAATAAVQLAVLPLALGDRHHLLSWIEQFPRGLRIRQIPVQFAVSQLYQSPSALVAKGLLIAALLAVVVVALLWFGGDARYRRGALRAGILALCIVAVPVALASVGVDYVIARNMIPALAPLAVVLGAACTVPRARALGAALGVLLVLVCVWAGVRIDGNAAYRRPDWRAAAAALGPATHARAVVAYAGNAAGAPLAIYLPGTAFSYSGQPPGDAPRTITELDVVGVTAQDVATPLPAGVRLISSTPVNDLLLVARFALAPAQRLTPTAMAALARTLLGPAPQGAPAVLLQRTAT